MYFVSWKKNQQKKNEIITDKCWQAIAVLTTLAVRRANAVPLRDKKNIWSEEREKVKINIKSARRQEQMW